LTFVSQAKNLAFKVNKEKNLLDALRVTAMRKRTDEAPNYVNALNGRYNIEEDKLEKYTGKEFLINGFEINYVKGTKPNIIDKVFDT